MPCCRDRYRTLLRGIFPKGTTGRENDLEAQSVGRLADYAKRYPGKLPRIAGELERRILRDSGSNKLGFVVIGLVALRELVVECGSEVDAFDTVVRNIILHMLDEAKSVRVVAAATDLLVAFAENAPQIEGDRALLAFMPSLCRMLEGAPEPHITFRGVQGIATIMSCAESNLLADVFGSTVPTVLSVLRRAPDVDRDDAGPGQGEEPDFRRACIDRERSIVADAVGSCPQSAALQERGSRVSMLARVALLRMGLVVNPVTLPQLLHPLFQSLRKWHWSPPSLVTSTLVLIRDGMQSRVGVASSLHLGLLRAPVLKSLLAPTTPALDAQQAEAALLDTARAMWAAWHLVGGASTRSVQHARESVDLVIGHVAAAVEVWYALQRRRMQRAPPSSAHLPRVAAPAPAPSPQWAGAAGLRADGRRRPVPNPLGTHIGRPPPDPTAAASAPPPHKRVNDPSASSSPSSSSSSAAAAAAAAASDAGAGRREPGAAEASPLHVLECCMTAALAQAVIVPPGVGGAAADWADGTEGADSTIGGADAVSDAPVWAAAHAVDAQGGMGLAASAGAGALATEPAPGLSSEDGVGRGVELEVAGAAEGGAEAGAAGSGVEVLRHLPESFSPSTPAQWGLDSGDRVGALVVDVAQVGAACIAAIGAQLRSGAARVDTASRALAQPSTRGAEKPFSAALQVLAKRSGAPPTVLCGPAEAPATERLRLPEGLLVVSLGAVRALFSQLQAFAAPAELPDAVVLPLLGLAASPPHLGSAHEQATFEATQQRAQRQGAPDPGAEPGCAEEAVSLAALRAVVSLVSPEVPLVRPLEPQARAPWSQVSAVTCASHLTASQQRSLYRTLVAVVRHPRASSGHVLECSQILLALLRASPHSMLATALPLLLSAQQEAVVRVQALARCTAPEEGTDVIPASVLRDSTSALARGGALRASSGVGVAAVAAAFNPLRRLAHVLALTGTVLRAAASALDVPALGRYAAELEQSWHGLDALGSDAFSVTGRLAAGEGGDTGSGAVVEGEEGEEEEEDAEGAEEEEGEDDAAVGAAASVGSLNSEEEMDAVPVGVGHVRYFPASPFLGVFPAEPVAPSAPSRGHGARLPALRLPSGPRVALLLGDSQPLASWVGDVASYSKALAESLQPAALAAAGRGSALGLPAATATSSGGEAAASTLRRARFESRTYSMPYLADLPAGAVPHPVLKALRQVGDRRMQAWAVSSLRRQMSGAEVSSPPRSRPPGATARIAPSPPPAYSRARHHADSAASASVGAGKAAAGGEGEEEEEEKGAPRVPAWRHAANRWPSPAQPARNGGEGYVAPLSAPQGSEVAPLNFGGVGGGRLSPAPAPPRSRRGSRGEPEAGRLLSASLAVSEIWEAVMREGKKPSAAGAPLASPPGDAVAPRPIAVPAIRPDDLEKNLAMAPVAEGSSGGAYGSSVLSAAHGKHPAALSASADAGDSWALMAGDGVA